MTALQTALDYIHRVSWQGSKPGLSRTRNLLKMLGNPENNLRFIHIAGTNGKGSTSAMLAAILRESGYKTGLYSSPYIYRFNERMQIGGVPISDDELVELTKEVAIHAKNMEDAPTEFELITALAMLFFQRNGCDYVVLETGLGGELDSTNVIPPPILAIITTIGLDHTAELGSTYAEIASAKAGIIKPGTTVLFYGENPEAEQVIRQKADVNDVPVYLPDFEKIRKLPGSVSQLHFDYGAFHDVSLSLTGAYQYKNAALVLEAVLLLRARGLQISDDAVYRALANLRWAGRFELLGEHPTLLSDGGHNPQGVAAAVDSLRLHFPGRKAIFLTGMMADKDIEGMISQMLPLAEHFITVTPVNPRAAKAEVLAEKIRALGGKAEAADSVENGLRCAFSAAKQEGIIFAIGSLYLYRELRDALEAIGEVE